MRARRRRLRRQRRNAERFAVMRVFSKSSLRARARRIQPRPIYKEPVIGHLSGVTFFRAETPS